jgi:hypothetical protein
MESTQLDFINQLRNMNNNTVINEIQESIYSNISKDNEDNNDNKNIELDKIHESIDLEINIVKAEIEKIKEYRKLTKNKDNVFNDMYIIKQKEMNRLRQQHFYYRNQKKILAYKKSKSIKIKIAKKISSDISLYINENLSINVQHINISSNTERIYMTSNKNDNISSTIEYTDNSSDTENNEPL